MRWLFICSGLVWLLACAPVSIAGNAELMREHVQRKRAARDMVLEELRSQGRLPANGIIEFEARSAPDPTNPEQMRIQIDAIRIVPGMMASPEAPSRTPDASMPSAPGSARSDTFHPVGVSKKVEYQTLDIPVQKDAVLSFSHSFRMESGVLQDALAVTDSSDANATAVPWYKRTE